MVHEVFLSGWYSNNFEWTSSMLSTLVRTYVFQLYIIILFSCELQVCHFDLGHAALNQLLEWCCRYRITDGINLPFRVLPSIKELGRTRMEVNVKVCDNPYYVWLSIVLGPCHPANKIGLSGRKSFWKIWYPGFESLLCNLCGYVHPMRYVWCWQVEAGLDQESSVCLNLLLNVLAWNCCRL